MSSPLTAAEYRFSYARGLAAAISCSLRGDLASAKTWLRGCSDILAHMRAAERARRGAR